MTRHRTFCALLALLALSAPALQAAAARTSAEILDASSPADWRPLAPENTLYLELPQGRIIIELAPDFAPRHAANIKTLAHEHYYDGLAILRAQDDYVVQWGDPDGKRPVGKAAATLPAEFARPLAPELPFAKLPDGDVYAPEVGFSYGLPAARDPAKKLSWLAHCYGMVGAGRDLSPDSGGGTELYVVIGHSPRHLDRNVTLVGRVVQGIEKLSTLPRGTGALGFYETPQERTPIRKLSVAADLPPEQRSPLEILRTDTATFASYVEARRNRREDWFVEPTGRIELCNVAVPIRPLKAVPAAAR